MQHIFDDSMQTAADPIGTKREGFSGEQIFVLSPRTFEGYIDHPLVRRLYLTDIGWFPHAEGHYRRRRNGTPEYILLYATSGSGTIELPDRKIRLGAGEVFVIPAGMPHVYYASGKDPWSLLWVHMRGDGIRDFPVDSMQITALRSEYAERRMFSYFEMIFRVLNADYTLGNFIYIGQVLALILAEVFFREKHNTTPVQNKHVSRIIRYLYAHLGEEVTLDRLSAEFDLSKSYLNQIFRENTGMTPIVFFIHLKMNEACSVLSTTDLKINKIAASLGYSDPYYFSRAFRKVVGVSPQQYRDHQTSLETQEKQ